jgi:uncharacterized integral membrane protein (TIGR00697 family)
MILGILIVANFLAVIILSRFGKIWITVLLPLLLVSGAIFSVKWLNVMGFDINVGNIFYATTFIIMHILIEQGKKKEAFLAIWVSAGALAYFSLITFFATTLNPNPQESISSAMSLVFSTTLRGTMASIFAFVLAQHTNIWIYDYFYKKHRGGKVLVRSSIAIIIGQLVDSVLFFSVAFYEVLPLPVLFTAALTGFAVKSIIGLVGSPLLYVERRLRE